MDLDDKKLGAEKQAKGTKQNKRIIGGGKNMI